MSTQTSLDVRRIGGRIGAEIVGADLSTPLEPAVQQEINAALLEHELIAFRGQNLDDDDNATHHTQVTP